MSIPVTRTKIIIPRRRTDLLSRPRLLNLLYDLLDYRLIVVSAPAGYGKTSLLVDFTRQANMPVCWYSLDPLDKDLQRFVAHFIACLVHVFPSFGKQSEAILDASGQGILNLHQLVTTIVNDAYEHIQEHFLLVLDDYHLVNDNPQIDEFINQFIQEADENCHLVLSSRTLLTLPDMPLLVARSQVGGLSFEELAFHAGEIQDLVLQNYQATIPDRAAEELARETEGWITGLILSAPALWQGMADRIRVARVSGIGLYDYLAQQVLDQQPVTVREFLLQTSLLDEFDAELCAAVLGTDRDWRNLIDTILQHNLFVLPVGEDGKSIRYHHLFRDFLQAHLEQAHPGERQEILQNLAQVYARRQEWEKAYATYRRLADVQATADLIEEAGSSLVKNGRMVTLAEWIDALPGELVAGRPNLLSLRGVAGVILGEVDQALGYLDRAESTLRLNNAFPDLARTLARRAVARRFQGDYQASLKDAQEALALAKRDPSLVPVKAEALRVTGTNFYQLGRLNEAIEKLSRSLEVYRALDDLQNIAMVQMELGLAYTSAGLYQQALAHDEQAYEYWRQVGNTVGQANLLNNLGVLRHLMGDYSQAGVYFEQALAHARQNRFTRVEAFTLCSIGDLYTELEAIDAAQSAYQQAREVAREIDSRFLQVYLDLAEAALARCKGEYQRARRLLKFAEQSVQAGDSAFERGIWRLEASRLSLESGQGPEAIEHLQEAIHCFAGGGQDVESARTHLYLAKAHFNIGNHDLAFSALEMAFNLAAGLESEHILVVAGREAKELLEAAQENHQTTIRATKLLSQVKQFEEKIPGLRRKLRTHTYSVPFAPPKIKILTLGKALVEKDGEPISAPEWVNQRKVREFFFCLLSNTEGLTKENIGLIFWPNSSISQLKLQFKNVIYRLRHALGQDIILFDEDRYWFNRSLDYEYDVEMFLAYLAEAQSASSAEKKKKVYRKALELYKGPYLPEVDGTWVAPERQRLRLLFIETVLNLARLHLESGEYEATLEYCQRALLEDPCLEEADRLAMRAYAAKGNRAAIARQFERCRQALLKEFNATPSPQTEALYKTLQH